MAGHGKGTAVSLVGAVVLAFFVMYLIVRIVHFISAIVFFVLYILVFAAIAVGLYGLIRFILNRWW